jgi:dinuclear metal center YbgI/SA1388 family protein
MPAAVPLHELASYLDDYLRIREVPDEPNAVNGLQVEAPGGVGRIVAAVDASQAAIESAVGPRVSGSVGISTGTTLLLVHHGLFWDGNIPIIGRRYRRVKALLEAGVALYSAHIPLDLHPDVGNNVVLARQLGVRVEGPFGPYRGVAIGVHGALAMPRAELVTRLNSLLRTDAKLIPGGPERVARVGVITGGAGDQIAAARDAGLDTFVTGEGAHHTYFDAMEWGLNVIYAGHYATETVGVQALAAHLSERFGIPWEFHDHPTGM